MPTTDGPRTIAAAADLIRTGELTPSELLERCLARIDRYEPRVKAWVVVDRDGAREQADQLTAELRNGQNRGPLHGIPVGVKDIIDVFDLPTGCGSKLWANSIARQDATCVARLRQAGAVILGKTVTTPFAFLDPPPTRNPWNLDRTPGGSSSGSAAAVACGMCLGALGSQTGGSLTRPASYCGVYSLKPTYDRLNLDGVLPLAASLDHLGFMANSISDLGLLYRAVAGDMDYAKYGGIDVRDPLPVGLNWGIARVRRKSNTALGLQLTNDFFPDRTTPAAADAFRRFIDRLAPADDTGPLITEVVLPPAFASVPTAHRVVMASEAAAYHAARMARHPDDYPPKMTELIRDGLTVSGAAYKQAIDLRSTLFFELTQRDIPCALLTPAAPGPAPGPETTGDAVFNAPWSFLGLPTVSIPIGRTPDGLPLAVQIIGEKFTEDALLRTAEEVSTCAGYEPGRLPL
jgi:aspartyl-tRNA(Asn)/glutamyl-tRNA(Gln) amidotransferase subunit A